jgi:hypothetical protein
MVYWRYVNAILLKYFRLFNIIDRYTWVSILIKLLFFIKFDSFDLFLQIYWTLILLIFNLGLLSCIIPTFTCALWCFLNFSHDGLRRHWFWQATNLTIVHSGRVFQFWRGFIVMRCHFCYLIFNCTGCCGRNQQVRFHLWIISCRLK